MTVGLATAQIGETSRFHSLTGSECYLCCHLVVNDHLPTK